jgi:Flp pilus assembly protein TadG
MRGTSDEVHDSVMIQQRYQPCAPRNGQERGFVLITMALSVVALIAMLGFAVDVGRVFIAKNETQAYCDSAALAAALALDGTVDGITNANKAVSDSINAWNLDSAKITSPTVTYAQAIGGPWVASPNPATGYIYVRVSATVPAKLYFLPVVVSQTTQNVTSSATAGQIDITTFPQGLSPYTAVSTTPAAANFGFVVGKSYDIQWPAVSNGANCDPSSKAKIDNCFIKPPCGDETFESKQAVINNWANSNSGYWGSTSNSVIEKEIVDLNNQTTPVAVGDNIQPVLTNGDKQAQAGYLDERVNQDINLTDNTVGTPNGANKYPANTYLGDAHNGRRLLPVPIVDPVDVSHTNVIGFGQFLLVVNNSSPSDYYKKSTNGNDPYCAIYAGPFDIGSIGPGAGGSTGASRVKLVQ